METWDDWSDLEINKAVAIAKGQKVIQQPMVNISRVWAIEGWDGGIYKIPDYCNSWADMGLIIAESKISLHWDWEVMNECSAIGSTYVMRSLGLRQINHEYTSKNPLRAAAIVFLMMNGVTTNENQN